MFWAEYWEGKEGENGVSFHGQYNLFCTYFSLDPSCSLPSSWPPSPAGGNLVLSARCDCSCSHRLEACGLRARERGWQQRKRDFFFTSFLQLLSLASLNISSALVNPQDSVRQLAWRGGAAGWAGEAKLQQGCSPCLSTQTSLLQLCRAPVGSRKESQLCFPLCSMTPMVTKFTTSL